MLGSPRYLRIGPRGSYHGLQSRIVRRQDFSLAGSCRLSPRLAMLGSPRYLRIGPRGSYHGLQDGVRMTDTAFLPAQIHSNPDVLLHGQQGHSVTCKPQQQLREISRQALPRLLGADARQTASQGDGDPHEQQPHDGREDEEFPQMVGYPHGVEPPESFVAWTDNSTPEQKAKTRPEAGIHGGPRRRRSPLEHRTRISPRAR